MLQITKDNIGDIICKYHNGKRIMITMVNDNLVHFLKESWAGQYCTEEHNIMGIIDHSPDAKKTFIDNLTLASTLDAAERSALKGILPGSIKDKIEAETALANVKKQQEDFENNINDKANERREMLLHSFITEINNLPSGSKAEFYKLSVEKTTSSDGLIINGKYYDRSSAEKFLLQSEEKTHSFDNLLSSAEKRSHNGINNTLHKINDEYEIQ